MGLPIFMLESELERAELRRLRRELTELKQQVSELSEVKDSVQALTKKVSATHDTVDDLIRMIARYQGAWGTLIMIGGAVLMALRLAAEQFNIKG